jgi:hypothetical protein
LSFIQIAARKGLRDGVRNMNANSRQLYHLGARPVARSTFSDANNARPADLFKAVSEKAYHRCLAFAPGHGFRFKNKLYSLDATTLRLCLETFPWAAFRKRRGARRRRHDGLRRGRAPGHGPAHGGLVRGVIRRSPRPPTRFPILPSPKKGKKKPGGVFMGASPPCPRKTPVIPV